MKGKKTFIIAELSANHNHKKQLAIDTIRQAKLCGADAIKLQTYTPDTMTLDCDKACFRIKGTLWDGYNLYSLYKEAYTPWEWHEELFRVAREEGLICFSTPFDITAVDFLESLGNPIYKIASFEITDIALIEYAARKNKPMIISTGIATLEDIDRALQVCREADNDDITLLKCTSAYPAPVKEANLLTIPDMQQRFQVKAGLSDHTMGSPVSLAAVAVGASVIERHFILDRKLGGPDATFSMEPTEFGDMCRQIRIIEDALGEVCYPSDITQIKGREFSRSLFVVEHMRKGEIVSEKNVRSIRPGNGLAPYYFKQILGQPVNRDIERGTPFSLDFIK